MNNNQDEEVDDAKEELDDSDIVYKISTSGADFDIEGLVNRFERGDIYRPQFQRNFVWSHKQASKFIESILLGLPIPGVFLYRDEEDQKLLIIDGLQRLTTLHSFYHGRLPNNDRVFKLVDVRQAYLGKTIKELAPEDQRRFFDKLIHAQIIQQASPSGDNSSVYHIFDRLNSNGTPLQPQEMRAAIYHGKFQEMLVKLNEDAGWRSIFGKIHNRSKDQELILRFFALFYELENYKSPINKFLNKFMQQNRRFKNIPHNEFQNLFTETMKRLSEALPEKPFRPSKALNVAFFDSFSVAVARVPNCSSNQIKIAYDLLMNNEKYLSLINDTTSSPNRVKRRFWKAVTAVKYASKY